MSLSPEARFTELFARTHSALLSYAVRRVADPADAADVVAETFLVVWRRLDDVPDGEEARPWLFGVARRVLANHHRGERRRNALAERLRAELIMITGEGEPTGGGEVPVVVRALERLSENDRELIRLVAWEQLSRDEVAVSLGVSRATARVRLHRARARLAAAMRELEEEDPALLVRSVNGGHREIERVVLSASVRQAEELS